MKPTYGQVMKALRERLRTDASFVILSREEFDALQPQEVGAEREFAMTLLKTMDTAIDLEKYMKRELTLCIANHLMEKGFIKVETYEDSALCVRRYRASIKVPPPEEQNNE